MWQIAFLGPILQVPYIYTILPLDLAIALSLANKIRQDGSLSIIFKRTYGFLIGLLCLCHYWQRNIPKQSQSLEENERQVELSHPSQVQLDQSILTSYKKHQVARPRSTTPQSRKSIGINHYCFKPLHFWVFGFTVFLQWLMN